MLGFYAPTFEGLKKETFLMVMLNVRKRVVDHVILAGGGKYYSFRESGGRELLGFEALRSVFGIEP